MHPRENPVQIYHFFFSGYRNLNTCLQKSEVSILRFKETEKKNVTDIVISEEKDRHEKRQMGDCTIDRHVCKI